MKYNIWDLSLLTSSPLTLLKDSNVFLITLASWTDEAPISIVSSTHYWWVYPFIPSCGKSPFMVPLAHLDFKYLPRPSTIRMKRNRDTGSPCWRPLEAWKVEEGAPLTRMEKKAKDTRLLIHLTQSCWNPKAFNTSFKNLQLTLS